MNRDVIISVVGIESGTDGENDKIEFVTEGKYYKRGNNHYLKYNESEMTGLDKTTTTLKIDGDTVSMTRFGQINTHMVFRSGQQHLGHYETPYGSFTIGIISDDVKINIGENSGDISINYVLEIDNDTKAAHSLKLSICNAGERN